ncbi:MAG: cofactor-independent phosphoglycerate mutase [Nitrospiraceae bacterium]|nr:MAG: cofactor-independent phosphoglycerate mutase [Nitrospiraceae bacterium]
MKYIVLIGDGMTGWPIKELGNKTCLQKASTPNMDKIAGEGIIGTARTIPHGFHPGSDVANLSILGYNPSQYYTGRAPLEAASIGVKLDEDDVAFRCNLVTLNFNGSNTLMDDYSSGHITTAEAGEIMKTVSEKLGSDEIKFYPGVSYRHLMVWKNGGADIQCFPPHDILGKDINGRLPSGEGEVLLRDLMERSVKILENHPVNQKRVNEGKKPANSIWLWGQGRKPQVPTYREKYGLTGALISAVDLTKGLGIYAGFEILQVPGVTGWLDTNYKGKAEYALNALQDVDFVYVHVESPDEAGHSGNYENKVKAIEDFDALVVGPVMQGLEERFKDYRVLLMPDHATPVEIRTHSSEPVPFAVVDSRNKRKNAGAAFNESVAGRKDILVFEEGYRLMDYFIKEV